MSDKSITYGIMKTNRRKYSKMDIARLIIGHGVWIGLSLHWGIMGLMIGSIIALMTAPKGFYVK